MKSDLKCTYSGWWLDMHLRLTVGHVVYIWIFDVGCPGYFTWKFNISFGIINP